MSSSDAPLPIRGTRERRILALLLVSADQFVPIERLVDAVWDSDPPATAETQVRNRISALRKSWSAVLPEPEAVLSTQNNGYMLHVDGHDLDLAEFERLVAQAGKEPAESSRLLRAALGLWRGPALAGVGGRIIENMAARLEERRLAVTEECLSQELALGQHTQIIDELSGLVAAYPFRERLIHQLMMALYRSGRQADALACYQQAARQLRDDLGLDPGPELRELHEAILRNSADLAAADRTSTGMQERPVRPAELPADVVDFAGRTYELEALDSLQVPIIAITGMGGAGKTALAIHWAHRIRDRYADGQFYVNLQGYGQGPPVSPIDALAALLRTLAVDVEQMPVELEEAERMFRSLVAGKRMLFVLDNTSSAQQVRPLLPGSPDCLVIITSRDNLAGLVASHGARRVAVGALADDDATSLLISILGRHRVIDEPAAITELIDVCASLPLALRIVAANLDSDPQQSIADYVRRLRKGDTLAALRIEGDSQAVRTAFDTSYATLSGAAQKVFRLMGDAPGPDVAIGAIAALAATTIDQVSEVVSRLSAANLVQRNGSGRYALHDLLKLYAKERANAQDEPQRRNAAMENLLDWYLDHVRAAACLLHPHMLRLSDVQLPSPRARFKDHATAMTWLDLERGNVVAAVEHAAQFGPRQYAWLFADALRGYYWLRGHTLEWLTTARTALKAAERELDPHGQAAARVSLAFAYYSQGRYHDAILNYRAALEFSRVAQWAEGEATALGNLGLTHSSAGDLRPAVDYLLEAAAIDRKVGRLLGLATTLSTLGAVEMRLGVPEAATEHLEEAFALYKDAGSLSGEAMTRGSLAYVMRIAGRFDEALEHITYALRIYRKIGDPDGEASALENLARIYLASGQHSLAKRNASEALILVNQTDRRRGLAGVLNALSRIDLALGNIQQSLDFSDGALSAAQANGSSYHAVEARIGRAAALHALGRADEAAIEAANAAELARQAEYQLLEREAQTVLR